MTTKQIEGTALVPSERSLAPYRTKVNAIQTLAREYSITKAKDLDTGADLLHKVKDIKKKLTERKTEITRPLMSALSSVRDLFRPLELAYTDAEETIKTKMLDWQDAESERIEKEKERAMARVKKGTMRADTAVTKIENLGEAPKAASGSVGKVQTREVPKLDIFDESLLPRDYLEPDRAKIFSALKSGTEVPGAKIVYQKIIAGR